MRDLNVDADLFIPYEWRKANSEYFDHVNNIIPLTWRLKQDYFWTYALSPKKETPVQGWKIHVSCQWGNEYNTLEKVIPLCIEHQVEFKFASDTRVLKTLLGKNCSRSASGKFITIYPQNKGIFNVLIELLYQDLKNEDGPYILSDRPYKDSKVLFYRYGGFKSFEKKNNFNQTKACIIDSDFHYTEDKREASFVLPDFISDELIANPDQANSNEDNQEHDAVFGGEFNMKAVIKHSNAGGVYLAENINTKEEVIIKEARPFVGIDDDGDCIDRLKKEYRILSKLDGLNIAPKPYALFQEWQHVFLAQEIVTGQTLRQYQIVNNKIIHATVAESELKSWFNDTVLIAISCIELMKKIHQRQIIFGDLSLNNLMIDPETLSVKLIDFEGACEQGVDDKVNFYTPGFAKTERLSRENIAYCDDFYALGCVLMAMFMPSSTMINLKSDYVDIFFSELHRDFNFPLTYVDCINYLLKNDNADLDYCIDLLRSIDCSVIHNIQLPSSVNLSSSAQELTTVIEGVVSFNAHHLRFDRRDRVLPFGPEFTQAISVDHGVAGVAYAWKKLTGDIPEQLQTWLEHKVTSCSDALPGLLNGTSGYAWVLQELGSEKLAAQVLQLTKLNRYLFTNISLGYGAAGYGYALLNRWKTTQQSEYLAQSKQIADAILLQATERDSAFFWESEDDELGVGVGLWEGGSGIALYLLYLYCATQEDKYLDAGRKALQADLNFGKETDGSYGFPKRSKFSILYPYLGYGTAGVASVALRYFAVTSEQHYLDFINNIKSSVSAKYTVNSGLFSGISGLGNYLLDAYDFLNDSSYHLLACQAASALKVFTVQRPEGCCFPANNRTKINTDYADGSAGTALFMHRLAHGGGNFNFMSDQILWDYLAQQGIAAPLIAEDVLVS